MNWDKIQKHLVRFLQITAAIYSGSTVGSLWIYHNDNWITYMPIVLLCLSFERYLSRN